MSDLLLSICIPTYNRAGYLRKCLDAIFSQMDPSFSDLVEIYVSNNNSPDNTDEVIADFKQRGFKLDYHKNAENMGPDANVGACFARGKGKYVWIFADDDFIMPGYLAQIIRILQDNDLGILYLRSFWYNEEREIPTDTVAVKTNLFDEPLDFFRQVHYWITFATGNIINKRSLPAADWQTQLQKTNLVQLGWMLPAIFLNQRNMIVETQTIACKLNNTGGYNLINVFSVNFNKILDKYIADKIVPKTAKSIINDELLKTFYPNFIKPGFGNDYLKTIGPLFKLYWANPYFYYHCLLFPVAKRMKKALIK